MATYGGREVALYGAIESTIGTAKDPDFTFNHDGAEFKRMIDEQMNENTYGRVDKYAGQQITRQYAQGAVKGYADSDSLGLWLTLMNAKSPVRKSGESGAKHTYNYTRANTATGKTATMYRKTPNYTEAYKGCRMSKFELEFAQDSWTKLSAELIGRDAEPVQSSNTAQYTPPTIDPTTLPLFRPVLASLKIANTTADLATASVIKAKTIKLTYTNDLKGYGTINSLEYADIIGASFDVMLEVTALFENTNIRQLWINKNYQAVEIKMTGDKSKGTVTPVFTITIPRATIGSWSDSTSLSDYVEETFMLNAHFDGTQTFTTSLENDITTGKY